MAEHDATGAPAGVTEAEGTGEPAGSPPPDDPIESAWEQLEAHWDDPEAHDRFVGLCLELGRLPEAGRRYREVRDRDPERSEDARQRIDRLLTLATRTLELTRTPPPDTRRTRSRLLLVALGLCLVMIGSVLWVWLR
jgi:hypothetical protein